LFFVRRVVWFTPLTCTAFPLNLKEGIRLAGSSDVIHCSRLPVISPFCSSILKKISFGKSLLSAFSKANVIIELSSQSVHGLFFLQLQPMLEKSSMTRPDFRKWARVCEIDMFAYEMTEINIIRQDGQFFFFLQILWRFLFFI
jgi:hypothetical protein